MKSLFNLILVFICMLGSTFSFAQYGGMGGMNGMNRMGGSMLNNGMQGNSVQPNNPTGPTEKEINAALDKYVATLKKELTLDDLQVIAIKNELVANNKSVEAINKSKIEEVEKTKEIAAVNEKLERNVLTYLNKTQKEKFKIMMEDRKAKIEALSKKR